MALLAHPGKNSAAPEQEKRTLLLDSTRRSHRLERRKQLTGLLFVLPGVIPLLIFVIYPTLSAFVLSFTNWQFVGTPTFQGFNNYTSLFGDPQFRQSLVVTLELALTTSIPTTLLAFVIALLLNAKIPGTGWYQTLFFLPSVLPTVVTTIVWSLLYQGNGVINISLNLAVPWLTDARWALLSVSLMMIWTNLGYFVIIMFAGVREIPIDYAEAARIDGANTLGVVWYIILPLIRPVLLFVVVIATTGALTLFTQTFLLTQGGPAGATRPLAELIYDLAFSYLNIGEATAASFVLLLLALLIAYVQFYVLRSKDI